MLRLSVGREGIGRKTREKDGDRGTARGGRKGGDGERETDRQTERIRKIDSFRPLSLMKGWRLHIDISFRFHNYSMYYERQRQTDRH